jgi:hypothetical protein
VAVGGNHNAFSFEQTALHFGAFALAKGNATIFFHDAMPGEAILLGAGMEDAYYLTSAIPETGSPGKRSVARHPTLRYVFEEHLDRYRFF